MTLRLLGKKVNLRELRNNDARSIYENANDFAIYRYTLRIPYPYNLEHARTFINKAQEGIKNKTGYQLGIELKKTKRIIGMMSLVHVNYKKKNAEIGYWLGRKYWRRGVATEALKLILDFGFDGLNLEKIYAKVMRPNKPSSGLLKKVGFELYSERKKAIIKNGKLMNELRYRMTKKDYLNN